MAGAEAERKKSVKSANRKAAAAGGVPSASTPQPQALGRTLLSDDEGEAMAAAGGAPSASTPQPQALGRTLLSDDEGEAIPASAHTSATVQLEMTPLPPPTQETNDERSPLSSASRRSREVIGIPGERSSARAKGKKGAAKGKKAEAQQTRREQPSRGRKK